jgi:hypothetical protein
MPRFRRTVPIDDYVLDVLMRDLVGHDQQPAAFLGLSPSLPRGRAPELETSRRQPAHDCGRNRTLEKCRATRPANFTAS